MPNYKGHVIGGSLAYVLLLYLLRYQNPSWITAIEWYSFAIIGALFPDIDIKSKGQKIFYRIVFVLVVFLAMQLRFQAVAFTSIIALAPLLVRHRGITHSLWFITSLSAIVVFYAYFYLPTYAAIIFFDIAFFFVGAVSHLWLDLGLPKMLKR